MVHSQKEPYLGIGNNIFSMDDLKFVSEEYNIKNTENYRASIQLNQDGFSVFIADKNKEILKIIHRNSPDVNSTLFMLKEDESLFEIVNLSFDKIEIILNTRDFTLIPQEYYKEEDILLYQTYNFPLESDDNLRTDFLNEHKIVCVYKIGREQQRIIDFFKNSPSVSHITGHYFSYIRNNYKAVQAVFAYNAGGNLLLSVFDNENIVFHNCYNVSYPEDSVYFILGIYKKFRLDTRIIQLFLSGFTPELQSDLHSLVGKYIQNIGEIASKLPFELAGNYNETYFINLIESSACV